MLDKIGKRIKTDGFFVLGIGLVGFGLWQVYQPLAPIVTGVLLIWMASVFSK